MYRNVLKKLNNVQTCTACKVVCVICFFALLVSIGTQVYFSNKFAVKGHEMNQLSASKDKLEQEISKLELQVSALSSLSEIESKATKMGFVKMDKELGFVGPIFVASNLR